MEFTGFGGGFDEDAEYEHPLSSLGQNDETTFHQKQDLENNAIGNIFEQHYIHRRKMTPIEDIGGSATHIEDTATPTEDTRSLGHLNDEELHKFSVDLTNHSSKFLDHMTTGMKVLSPIKFAHHSSIFDSLHPSVKEVLSHPTKTKQEKDIQFSKMIFNTIGAANKASAPKILNEIPKKLSDIMERMVYL